MKPTKKTNATRILLIDKFIPLDKAVGQYPDVFLATVAVLDDETQTPRNWLRPYADDRLKVDMGGVTVRAFKSDSNGVLSSITGTRVHCGNASEYAEVAKALTVFCDRFGKSCETLGCPQNSIDRMAREISCLGVSEVFERPEGDSSNWLSKGSWIRTPIGSLANRLHDTFPVVTA
jgi:hypothetical protein